MQSSLKYHGIVCDLDGTLVDSKLDFGEMRAVMGVPKGGGILEFMASLPEARLARAKEILDRFEFNGAKEATLIPGVDRFLKRVREAGIPFGILTRNSRRVAEFTMDRFGIQPEILVTREDARPKPDPDGLHLILKKWGLTNHQAIFVGDYRFDIETGVNAGVPTALYVPNKEPDYAHLATHTFRTYDALERIVFG